MINLKKLSIFVALSASVVIVGGCSSMSTSEKNTSSMSDKTRYCRPGNGVVFRTENPEKVDPIRILKDHEHGCV